MKNNEDYLWLLNDSEYEKQKKAYPQREPIRIVRTIDPALIGEPAVGIYRGLGIYENE